MRGGEDEERPIEVEDEEGPNVVYGELRHG